jgi:hypothetical protein
VDPDRHHHQTGSALPHRPGPESTDQPLKRECLVQILLRMAGSGASGRLPPVLRCTPPAPRVRQVIARWGAKGHLLVASLCTAQPERPRAWSSPGPRRFNPADDMG